MRRIACVLLGIVMFVGLPAAAFASTSSNFFNTANWRWPGTNRLPASQDYDQQMSGSKTGRIRANVSGCPARPAAINWRFVHDISGLPDRTEAAKDNMTFCQNPWYSGDIDWPRGKYHWDAVERYSGQPGATGYLMAED